MQIDGRCIPEHASQSLGALMMSPLRAEENALARNWLRAQDLGPTHTALVTTTIRASIYWAVTVYRAWQQGFYCTSAQVSLHP